MSSGSRSNSLQPAKAYPPSILSAPIAMLVAGHGDSSVFDGTGSLACVTLRTWLRSYDAQGPRRSMPPCDVCSRSLRWNNFVHVAGRDPRCSKGIVNLLPLPIVSGGMALFTLAEWLWPFGKRARCDRIQPALMLISLAGVHIAIFLVRYLFPVERG